MKKRAEHRGSGHLVVLFVAVVLVGVGLVGYKVASTNKTIENRATAATTVKPQRQVTTTSTALTSAKKELTKTSDQVNSELDTSALDEDIEELDIE